MNDHVASTICAHTRKLFAGLPSQKRGHSSLTISYMRANYHLVEQKSVGFEEGVLNEAGMPTFACWSLGLGAGRRLTVSVRSEL